MKRLSLFFVLAFIVSLNLVADIVYLESKSQAEHDATLDIEYHVTPEELEKVVEFEEVYYFPTFTPPQPFVRPVAEFEHMSGVLVRYPLGVPLEFIKEMANEIRVVTIVSSESVKNQAISAYSNIDINMSNCEFIIAGTNSYWTRDYGPWFSFGGNGELNVIDFTYNRPRPLDNNFMSHYATYDTLSIYHMNIVQTGGNYMTDGISIAASSHIAYSENSNNQALVNQAMYDYLGIETYHVVQDPNGDYIDHIDCWGKFLSPDKILIRSVPTTHPRYNQVEEIAEYFSTQMSAWERPFEVVRVFNPQNQPYTNSLILNDRVFVPITGSTHDEAALQVYRDAMPGYRIIGVPNNTSNPWLGTDALHCRTHELAERRVVFINHLPLAKEINMQNEVEINASILSLTGYDLISDSVKVYYKINQSDFQSIAMTQCSNFIDDYYVSISGFVPGDTLYYYVRAVDENGRATNHPYIGSAGAHYSVVQSDTLAPVITHTLINEINASDLPVLISAHVVDNYQVEGVYFEYYTEDEMSFVSELMDALDGDIYVYSLNLSVDNIKSIFYSIKDLDSSNPSNVSMLPVQGWQQIEFNTSTDFQELLHKPLTLSVYPNPLRINDKQNLNINIATDNSNDIKVSLYNVKGQKIIENDIYLEKNKINAVSWDLNKYNLANGIYFVRFQNSDVSVNKKLLILK